MPDSVTNITELRNSSQARLCGVSQFFSSGFCGWKQPEITSPTSGYAGIELITFEKSSSRYSVASEKSPRSDNDYDKRGDQALNITQQKTSCATDTKVLGVTDHCVSVLREECARQNHGAISLITDWRAR